MRTHPISANREASSGYSGEERTISFAPNQALPAGWFVIQLDSGHYMATNGNIESAITVNRFHARKWAIQLSKV